MVADASLGTRCRTGLVESDSLPGRVMRATQITIRMTTPFSTLAINMISPRAQARPTGSCACCRWSWSSPSQGILQCAGGGLDEARIAGRNSIGSASLSNKGPSGRGCLKAFGKDDLCDMIDCHTSAFSRVSTSSRLLVGAFMPRSCDRRRTSVCMSCGTGFISLAKDVRSSITAQG